MAKNPTAFNAPTEGKTKKMTKAEFLVALTEVNVTLEKQIAQARENQRQLNAKNEELSQRIAETRKLIEAL